MKTRSTSALIAVLALLPALTQAANQTNNTYFSNPLFNALFGVIIVLAIIILALAGAMRNFIGSEMFIRKMREQAATKKAGRKTLTAVVALFAGDLFAQGAPVSDLIGGLDQTTFYTMIAVIAGELIVLAVLFTTFRTMIGSQQAKQTTASVKPAVAKKTLLDKVNATVAVEEEETIMLDHEYDGIRELDNVLPPWWKYGFYLTIVVSVVYMVIYHVTDSLPLQKAEYEASVVRAEAEVAAFMKNSASNVDETTVKMLTDASDLQAGKEIYDMSCVACHGRFGEGGVGPNLTDPYWMHSGGISDIFKSIKYGWPDKGMKSWKEDFSPMQIAQITSYIKSLQGSNPPNAKPAQGELYEEALSVPSDSLAANTDSTGRLTSQKLR